MVLRELSGAQGKMIKEKTTSVKNLARDTAPLNKSKKWLAYSTAAAIWAKRINVFYSLLFAKYEKYREGQLTYWKIKKGILQAISFQEQHQEQNESLMWYGTTVIILVIIKKDKGKSIITIFVIIKKGEEHICHNYCH